MITIFGSCRQEPIQKHFKLTSIQRELNFPHYSKEVLQEIQYLKYKNISQKNTQFAFRTGILENYQITDNMYDVFKQEFNNTELFIIEIASRISYKWRDSDGGEFYTHHIAADGRNFPYNIEIRDLTDEEIEEDIIQIKRELYPKKMLLLSHFTTYTHGKRYELTQLLEKICRKYDIPFFNQTEIIEKYGLELINTDEKVFAHYNSRGQDLIADILKEKVCEILHI